MGARSLNKEELEQCRAAFKNLSSEDFDAREQALTFLTSKGTAVLPLADEFAKDKDPEVANHAKGLHQRLLFNYDGYLPTDPALKAALKKPADPQMDITGTISKRMKRMADAAGIKLVIDKSVALADVPEELGGRWPTVGTTLSGLASFTRAEIVPRGDVLIVADPMVAAQLSTQRHTFDWSHLGFNRDEADRVSKALVTFFPALHTELHTGSEVFTISGSEESIVRAARLIALLKPGAADAIWPAPAAGADVAELLKTLSTPVTIALLSEEPINVLAQFKKQKIDVFAASPSTPEAGLQAPPFPGDLLGAAPMRLTLRDIPAGLALRWIERRTKQVTEQLGNMSLLYRISSDMKLQLKLESRNGSVLEKHLCGADVAFLYPKGATPNAATDAAAKAALLKAIESHLALLPALAVEQDIAVLRGRLFVQADAGTAGCILHLVKGWRERGEPPAPAAWWAALETTLNTPVDWDGKDLEGKPLSGSRVIPTLRALGKLNLLLEDAPDGTAGEFKLQREDAHLMAPGKHTLRQLLDALAEKTKAQWKVEAGAITLTPGR